MKLREIENIVIAFLFGVLLLACKPQKEILYLQDASAGEWGSVVPVDIRLRTADKISIIVNCKTQESNQLYNLPYVMRQHGAEGASVNTTILGYTVDANGDIDFPVVGKLHVAGLTRQEVAIAVKLALQAKGEKDPAVTVNYLNLAFSVVGEVNNPGQYPINKDNITLLEAISTAGDLTIYGKRGNVRVMRLVDGKQVTYEVDLRSAQSVYSSPAYYLQQNDIVYVEPNNMRARQSTVNGNYFRSTSFWVSLASITAAILIAIFK